jgi:hypothetical protein
MTFCTLGGTVISLNIILFEYNGVLYSFGVEMLSNGTKKVNKALV